MPELTGRRTFAILAGVCYTIKSLAHSGFCRRKEYNKEEILWQIREKRKTEKSSLQHGL